jgi:hypothetical protein
MNSVVKIIDLTALRNHTNKIDVDDPVELKLIEYYSYYVTSEFNTIKDFTNYLLSVRYYKVAEYPYNELRTFYNTKRYLNTILKFLGLIDYLVTKQIGCVFENVRFGKIVEDNEKLLVEMVVDHE